MTEIEFNRLSELVNRVRRECDSVMREARLIYSKPEGETGPTRDRSGIEFALGEMLRHSQKAVDVHVRKVE